MKCKLKLNFQWLDIRFFDEYKDYIEDGSEIDDDILYSFYEDEILEDVEITENKNYESGKLAIIMNKKGDTMSMNLTLIEKLEGE